MAARSSVLFGLVLATAVAVVSYKLHGLTGNLVDTYARSSFADTRRKAEKYGARGTTVRALRPR